jgi:hypothetical protein
MELLNATRMKAAYTMGLRPDGRELLVVVVKGTFAFPSDGAEPEIAEEQADLVMADVFTGEPGLSAPVYESDFAPVKPRCDILLNGSAYAPNGRPSERVEVGVRVGSLSKLFAVVGNRAWQRTMEGYIPGNPEPFVQKPISYDNAFGGTDKSFEDERKHTAYVPNPAGRGFYANTAPEAVEGKPLPNTEESNHPVRDPKGKYQPMAFGPVGRAWPPRPKFAGTYDQDWIDNVFPFLPADFDDRYFQCAPEDQQLERLQAGEEVTLLNLTPEGRTAFRVPTIDVPVTFYLKNHEEQKNLAVNDTLIIEPDKRRFIMVWRTALPLKKNMFEVAQVVVGTMSRAWHRARELGKTWYPSLGHLIDERKAERAEAENAEDAETLAEEDAETRGQGDAEIVGRD